MTSHNWHLFAYLICILNKNIIVLLNSPALRGIHSIHSQFCVAIHIRVLWICVRMIYIIGVMWDVLFLVDCTFLGLSQKYTNVLTAMNKKRVMNARTSNSHTNPFFLCIRVLFFHTIRLWMSIHCFIHWWIVGPFWHRMHELAVNLEVSCSLPRLTLDYAPEIIAWRCKSS